jgi:YVTN family beta-propeller protein
MGLRHGCLRLGVLAAALLGVGATSCVSASSAAASAVINTINVAYPVGVSSDGTHVWVTNLGENTVSEIEASTGEVINTINVGKLPLGVSSDGTHVWVTNHTDNTVSEIKVASGEVIRTINVGRDPFGVSSDGTHVWIANSAADTVSEIEASSGEVINTIKAGFEPLGVSSDGTDVWVTNGGDNTVSEIEASSGEVIRTIGVGNEPSGVSSDGTHVWVANAGEDTLSEIEASSGKVVGTINVGSYPEGVSSDGTDVWVTNTGENTVSEILISTSPPTAEIESPGTGGTYKQGEAVHMRFSCSEGEGGPGLESCTDENGVPSSEEGTLETETLGPHTYTVTARSEDGMTGSATIEYTVDAPAAACTRVVGHGRYGPKGSQPVNRVRNDVSTNLAEPQELHVEIKGQKGTFALGKLTSASCTAVDGGLQFSGQGDAHQNGHRGYEVRFSFTQKNGETDFTATLEKNGAIVYSVKDEPLTHAKETFG